MKKLSLIVLSTAFVLFGSTSAFACGGHNEPECTPVAPTTTTGSAAVINGQLQGQVGGGTSTSQSHLVGSAGAQGEFGAGSATAGNDAYDSQDQFQATNGFETTKDLITGNESGGSWDSTQTQAAAGNTTGGDYTYVQGQGQAGGSFAVHDNAGTAGIAGSAYAGAGATNVQVSDGAVAADQGQTFNGQYYSGNNGTNGFTEQFGSQQVEMANGASIDGSGSGGSSVGVLQAGGTVAANNGEGTLMAGGGAAIAAGSATGGAVICNPTESPVGNASYTAKQEHSYSQASQSDDGHTWQTANGTVGTSIHGSTL